MAYDDILITYKCRKFFKHLRIKNIKNMFSVKIKTKKCFHNNYGSACVGHLLDPLSRFVTMPTCNGQIPCRTAHASRGKN